MSSQCLQTNQILVGKTYMLLGHIFMNGIISEA